MAAGVLYRCCLRVKIVVAKHRLKLISLFVPYQTSFGSEDTAEMPQPRYPLIDYSPVQLRSPSGCDKKF